MSPILFPLPSQVKRQIRRMQRQTRDKALAMRCQVILLAQRLVQALPPTEMLFYEDEVDIHLNPKIGPDWMNRGKQKYVVTPGRNQKRYLAGALDLRSGLLLWRESKRKNSLLFIDLLHRLTQGNPQAKVIHLILDDFKIHDSKAVQAAVAALGGKSKAALPAAVLPG